MLSKYYRYISKETSKEEERISKILKSKVAERFPEAESIYPGGTLGIFFKLKIENECYFVKTHRDSSMQKKNLQKELEVMQCLYGETLKIKTFVIESELGIHLFVAMKYLQKIEKEYSIEEITKIIEEYSECLKMRSFLNVNYDRGDLKKAAINSYEKLAKADLISRCNVKRCEDAIRRMDQYESFEKILCHGDLSNANIMQMNNKAFVIDWEDAIWAYPGYDLLYWLTFYSQRKYYSRELLKKLKIESQFGKDIMLSIIAVKSYMSYLNGSYLTNKVTIEERMNEIMQL